MPKLSSLALAQSEKRGPTQTRTGVRRSLLHKIGNFKIVPGGTSMAHSLRLG